jgi:hypothetical protein
MDYAKLTSLRARRKGRKVAAPERTNLYHAAVLRTAILSRNHGHQMRLMP